MIRFLYILCVSCVLSCFSWATPTDTLRFPQHNASQVPANVRLQIYFNEPMQKGVGNIQIFDAATNIQIFSIPVSCSCVSVLGNRVSIGLPSLLSAGQEVYVIIPPNAFKNLSGVYFAGFQLPTDWRFTVAMGLITHQSFSPANGSACVPLQQNTLQVVLSGAVESNPTALRWIKIIERTTQVLHEAIRVPSSQVIANNSNIVSFTISRPFKPATQYYVLIEPASFSNASNFVYEGIYDENIWSFTTAEEKPQTQNLEICGASNVLLRASAANSSPTAFYEYRWYRTATGGEPIKDTNGQVINTDTLRIFVQNTTTFYVSVWNAGCESQRTALQVLVKPLPNSTLPPEEIRVGKGVKINLQANGGVKYTWQPATGLSDANIPNPELIAQDNITYTVTIENEFGCSLQKSVSIVIDDSDKDFFLPTIFSPNGDGTNDFFRIKGRNIVEVEWSIYDRHGKLLYRTTSIDEAMNTGWDGTYNNIPQAQDTYIWTLKGKFSDGSPLPQKAGSVLLIR